MTTREIADLHGLTFSSVLPHTQAARAQLVAEGRTCGCGRPVGHQGTCWATYKRADQPRRDPAKRRAEVVETVAQTAPIDDRDLLQAIATAIPARISRADRDELTTELYLGVRGGTIRIEEIARAAKRLRQRAFFATRHAPSSFDQEMFSDGGATLHDVVSDTTAASQIDAIRIGELPP